MRSKILQVLLLVIVIPFIGFEIFERSEATSAQYREVTRMEGITHPAVEAAVAVALDDRKMTQSEYSGIMKIAYKYRGDMH
jgi:tryptophan synthase beta subunit